MTELLQVDSATQAGQLLHPLRQSVLEHADRPRSATEIAGILGEPRQKVNYHVRELARAGLLRAAGRRRKRNMIEQRYQRVARGYALSPALLGPLGLAPEQIEDRASAGYLLALATRTQVEVGRWLEAATRTDRRLPTLSIDVEVAFTDPDQRARFAAELRDAIAAVVERHTAPVSDPSGGAPGESRARRYRLVCGCYPRPTDPDHDRDTDTETDSAEDPP